jgi:hypothetical protein
MLQIDEPVLRSATYSIIHLACIIGLVFLLVKTWRRLAEKRRNSPTAIGLGSPIHIMMQFEVVIMVGLVFINLSSDILLYLRFNSALNPTFSDPAALLACEILNMSFQAVLAVFAWQLAVFSNKVLLFKGRWFLRACSVAMLAIVAIVVVGTIAGFAWSGYDPTTGKREPSSLIMGLNGVFIILVVIPAILGSIHAMRRAPGKLEQYGMLFITIFYVMILFVIVFEAIFALSGQYIFSFASWFLIPAGIYFAYLGLILPPSIRRRLIKED